MSASVSGRNAAAVGKRRRQRRALPRCQVEPPSCYDVWSKRIRNITGGCRVSDRERHDHRSVSRREDTLQRNAEVEHQIGLHIVVRLRAAGIAEDGRRKRNALFVADGL